MNETYCIDRIPPHDTDAERAVLGSMLLEGEAAVLAVSMLSEADFYRSAHRRIFKSICELDSGGVLPDEIVVQDKLGQDLEEIGGAEYIRELVQCVPSAANMQRYAGIVKEKAGVRAIVAAAATAIQDAETMPAAEVLEKWRDAVEEISFGRKVEPMSLADALDDVPTKPYVIRCLPALQEKTTGIYSGGITVISGPPGSGKTTLAMQIVGEVAAGMNDKVHIWPQDQRAYSLARMIWASMMDEEIGRLEATGTRGDIEKLPITFNPPDAKFVLGEVLTTIRSLKAEGYRWFVIDYLSLMEAAGRFQGEWEKSAYCGKRLKAEAQKLNVYCIVIQSSVKPEAESPHPKYMAGGRELEHAADQLWWLQPPKPGKAGEPTDVYLFKSRFAGIGRIQLDLRGAHHRFAPAGSDP